MDTKSEREIFWAYFRGQGFSSNEEESFSVYVDSRVSRYEVF